MAHSLQKYYYKYQMALLNILLWSSSGLLVLLTSLRNSISSIFRGSQNVIEKLFSSLSCKHSVADMFFCCCNDFFSSIKLYFMILPSRNCTYLVITLRDDLIYRQDQLKQNSITWTLRVSQSHKLFEITPPLISYCSFKAVHFKWDKMKYHK